MLIRKFQLACILLICTALLLTPSARAAGPARLVKDLLPGSNASRPSSLTNVNGTLFFWAGDNITYTLWKSDGTAAGTMPVRRMVSLLYELTAMNGVLYFGAGALWKSDGTEAGTVPITNIDSGINELQPAYLTNVDGTLFFSADDGRYGDELWKSDGTPEGTVMVKNIISSGSSSPYPIIGINGTLFFTAFGEGVGRELWKSDGTAAGTVLVKDINPGLEPSRIGWPVNVNGTLFFSAYDGREYGLWKSDGTSAGTVLVKDITPGPEGFIPRYLTNVNGTLFFSAGTADTGAELWKSDGSAGGTMLLKDINLGAGSSYLQDPTNVNGTLLFAPWDVINGVSAPGLWRSDSTPIGTVRVKDVLLSLPIQITQVRPDGRTLFAAYNAVAGRRELWQTDGTAPGTLRLQDIGPGLIDSSPQDFIVAGSRTFFTADDGSTGRELWVIDNVDLGPPLLRDRAVIAHGTPISGTLGYADTAAYPLTYSIVANGSKGVAAITNSVSGAFTYTPNPGARGSDRFTFSANDGKHAPVVATVTVLLGPFAFLPKVSR